MIYPVVEAGMNFQKMQKNYILKLEELISHKIHLVSTGAEREEYLLRD